MVPLVEGTHYRQQEDQVNLSPHPSKAIVDCIFCEELIDVSVGNKRKYSSDGRGYRLDRLQHHLQAKCKSELIDDNVQTLFDVGFLREDASATGG
jgi:hypothetical protein